MNKKTRTVYQVGFARMGLNQWEVGGFGYSKEEAKQRFKQNLKRFYEENPCYENGKFQGNWEYIETSFEEALCDS